MGRLREVILAAILIAVGLGVYAPSLNNSFVMDDEAEITQNTLIQDLNNIPRLFMGSTMAVDGQQALGGIYYRPVMMTSFAFVWKLAGNSPYAYHLLQLVIHIFNALLFYAFARRFLAWFIAALAAGLFLVHPLNTEAVVYASSLQEPLFLFFGLFAINWITWRPSLKWFDAAVVAIFFLMALLSKETAILLMLSASVLISKNRSERLRFGFAAISAVSVYLLLRIGVAGLTSATDATTRIARADLPTRLITVPSVLGHYLFKFLVPINLTVTQDWVKSSADFQSFWAPLIGSIAIFTAMAAYHFARRDRHYTFFFLIAISALVLHSQIFIPLDGTVADRWFYLTSIGLIGGIALIADRELRERRLLGGMVLGMALSFLALVAWRAQTRSLDWQDGLTLYAHDLALLPDSFDLQNNYGVELFRRGKISEAKAHFERSTELAPHWTVNWNNLGAAHQRLGDLESAEQAYRRSIENGAYPLAYENFAAILINRGKTQEAKSFLTNSALVKFPGSRNLNEYWNILTQSQ